MSHNITIRPAERGDCPLLLTLIREFAEYVKKPEQVTATVEILEESLFVRRTAEVLLPLCDGEVIGYALFFHNFSTFLGKPGIYLEDLYIRRNHRGHGAGKAVFAELSRIALERDCGRIDWQCHDWNKSSVEFYKSLGAEEINGAMNFRLTGFAVNSE
ncbi:N-acetyltransferase [Clostridia bacterium]|nr:N-acetyltransferase [Clostridia bacterium]